MNPWLLLGIVLVSIASLGGAYSKGYADARSKYEVKVLKETVKEAVKHEKKTHEIITLPIDDLKRRYCKWVRDDERECLENKNIPLR
jgi:hypothetical protein